MREILEMDYSESVFSPRRSSLFHHKYNKDELCTTLAQEELRIRSNKIKDELKIPMVNKCTHGCIGIDFSLVRQCSSNGSTANCTKAHTKRQWALAQLASPPGFEPRHGRLGFKAINSL